MTRVDTLEPEFVEEIPRALSSGVLYISVAYGTATHLCCCGCGTEVVTPIHPTRWRLTYDGDTVSLDPSVGNWALPCQSHYVVSKNRVLWAGSWTKDRIEAARARERRDADRYFDATPRDQDPQDSPRRLGGRHGRRRRLPWRRED